MGLPAAQPPRPYQLQAAINAVHCDAPTTADTDWSQVLALYGQLLAFAPTDVVRLNRAVAGRSRWPSWPGQPRRWRSSTGLDLDDYHPYHATRAELLHRLSTLTGTLRQPPTGAGR